MKISMDPVAWIRSERKDAIDDNWDIVSSYIELDKKYKTDAIKGLESFSHLEIIYYFHKVNPEKIRTAAARPRGNPAWPETGIFSQRKKARPNLIGATIVRLERIEGNKIYIKGLDAIDGTPVLDIKPVFKEFLPVGSIKQPEWVSELMKGYWSG